jgi:hypothetical protein
MIEIRCHVCGGMLGGHPLEYQMGCTKNPYQETCSQECFDIYYIEPDKIVEEQTQ